LFAPSSRKSHLLTFYYYLEELRQLRWDILALADGFGWTDRPATYIPPASDNKGVNWVFPAAPSRRQKELSELLKKKV
jgi:hypothetical protein